MDKPVFLYRWLVLFAFMLGTAYAAFAQDANLARAQHIYELFAAGQGDSIHVALNKDLQAKLAPAVFNDTFRQTEKMMGKLKSKGGWTTETIQNVTIYCSDLEFEHYKLRFLVAFDADGGMNTIRLAPAQEASTAKPIAYDNTKMEERDITVGADGFKLPGTLTLPKFAEGTGTRKVPCVILVHGSGPQDRDETIGPNKPFRDLAWGLAERGIAVVRYDKRTKVYGAASVPAGRKMDYDTEAVDDAVAAVLQVKSIPEINIDSIYVLGHSLGATVAPRIAQHSGGLAGIVVLAGLARPFEDALTEQLTYIASLTGAKVDVQEQIAELKKQTGGTESYWAFANTYKPVEAAAKLKLPILILQGERDYQVTMEDFGLWCLGLFRCKNAYFKSYPKLNHLFQEGNGKATPMEYNHASPFAAYVIDDIAAFVRGETEKL